MFFDHHPRWLLMFRRIGWALTLALTLLLLQSAFWSERVPLVLKLAVAGVAMLSAVRPADGLLVVTGLVPFGHLLTTSVWVAYPFALSEASVLAFSAGYLWQRRRALETTVRSDHLAVAARLFALVVVASCLVHLGELQVWHDYPLQYASGFVRFLATEYLTTLPDPRPWVDGRAFVSTAALLLEGLGLLLSARTLCTQQRPLTRRLTNVCIAAGVGLALLSFYEPLMLALSSNRSLLASLAYFNRWPSPGIPSLDTAGPYFMVMMFITLGTAASSKASLVPGLPAAALCGMAMWITGTRSAIVAGLATAVAGVVWRVAARVRWLSPLRAVLLAALVALAVSVSVVIYNPFDILGTHGNETLYERVLLSETALRMMASAPLSGVGIGRYELRYKEFAPPKLLLQNITYNAHNYFLWIGAELGAIGLGSFLWLLGSAFAVVWAQLNSRRSDYRFLGTCAGIIAFVITWSIGQPLGIPQVAYTFWILLGVAVAPSLADASAVTLPHRYPLFARLALGATALVVIGSVPIRAHRAISEIDLSRVAYGFYNPGTSDNRDFLWAGPQVRFFKRASVKVINIPLAAKLGDTPNGADVDILVNGSLAHHIELRDKQWHDIRVDAPVSSEPFWQVDLKITPVDVPADLEDARRRVAISEISVEPRP